MTITGGRRKADTVRGGGFLIGLAGACVLATGCGTQVARTDVPPDALTAAVTRTTTQTARVAITMTTQMQSMSVSFTETGMFDFAHSRGVISTQSPLGMTELFVPPKTYFKFSASASPQLPPGKTWLAVGDGLFGASADIALGPFGGVASPWDLLASLTAMSGSEKKIGTTTIRGVPVTEYQVNADPAKAASRLPSWEREGFRQFAKILGTSSVPVDVWVDGQNLVRRVQVSVNAPAGTSGLAGLGGSGELRLVESTDFYDFGVPVRVAAPPASKVASFSQIMIGMSGSSTGSGVSGSGVFAGSARPPKAAGTLTPAQTAAAEQAVAAFWVALGRNDPGAVARTVLPSQRSCASSGLDGAPKITVSSFRINSAQPAGTGRATVRFTVSATASLAGQDIPVFPQGSGIVQWFVTAESAGHWCVDLTASSVSSFVGPCS